jgi:hypothetical protein
MSEVQFDALTERCDIGGCPAAGQVEFVFVADNRKGFLIYCKHHGDAFELTAMTKGFLVDRDNRANLSESNPGLNNQTGE